MPSLIIAVFILQLVIHAVNTLGVSTINALVRLLELSGPANTDVSIAVEYLQQTAHAHVCRGG